MGAAVRLDGRGDLLLVERSRARDLGPGRVFVDCGLLGQPVVRDDVGQGVGKQPASNTDCAKRHQRSSGTVSMELQRRRGLRRFHVKVERGGPKREFIVCLS